MPIEYCYRPLNSSKEYDNALIEAGDGIFISTYPDGERKIIAIDCNDADDGGTVKILQPDGPFADIDTDFVERSDMPQADEMIRVYKNRPHEQLVVHPIEESGSRGFIVARYVSSLAITKSLLIPRGLIFPDGRVRIVSD
jgi:hypothetical protein